MSSGLERYAWVCGERRRISQPSIGGALPAKRAGLKSPRAGVQDATGAAGDLWQKN